MSERNTHTTAGRLLPFKVAEATLIEAGKMVAVGADGYAVEAADTAGLIVVGIAAETVDNSNGADGALAVTVRRGEVYKLNNGTTAVTQAGVGSTVVVEDDETVTTAAAATNDIVAGTCLGVEADGVWVAIG